MQESFPGREQPAQLVGRGLAGGAPWLAPANPDPRLGEAIGVQDVLLLYPPSLVGEGACTPAPSAPC